MAFEVGQFLLFALACASYFFQPSSMPFNHPMPPEVEKSIEKIRLEDPWSVNIHTVSYGILVRNYYLQSAIIFFFFLLAITRYQEFNRTWRVWGYSLLLIANQLTYSHFLSKIAHPLELPATYLLVLGIAFIFFDFLAVIIYYVIYGTVTAQGAPVQPVAGSAAPHAGSGQQKNQQNNNVKKKKNH